MSDYGDYPSLEDTIMQEVLFDPKSFLINIDEILSLPEKEEVWLVKSIVLSQGITIVSGLPNHFKSMFVQMLVKAVASGTLFLNQFETQQGAVLVIDREIPTQRLRRRWKALGDLHGLPIYFYPYNKPFKLDNKKDAERLREIVENNNIKLVVIDTFNRSHGGKEINSSGDVGQIFEPLKVILENTSIILIHHSNKTGYSRETPTPEELLGSVDFSAQTDLLFTLRKQDQHTIRVYNLKSRDSELIPPFEIRFVGYPNNTIDLLYEGEMQVENTPVEQREKTILEFLKTGRKAKTELIAFMELQGHKEKTVNNVLTTLRDKKIIGSEHVGREAYYFLLEHFRNNDSPFPTPRDLGSKETLSQSDEEEPMI